MDCIAARYTRTPSPCGVCTTSSTRSAAISESRHPVVPRNEVLAALRRAGAPFERTPGELSDHTMVTTGAMTKRVDRLVAADDGRSRVVALTPTGRALIDDAFTEHLANEARLLAALPEQDAAQLERILTTWLAALDE